MELARIKVDAESTDWKDEIALDVDGIKVKKAIPYELKRGMAGLLEGLLVVEDEEDEIIYESIMYDVAFFAIFCVFYTNIDADLDTMTAWVKLYDYAVNKGYVQKFYSAASDDLEAVRSMYERIKDAHIKRYQKEHSTVNKLAKLAEQTEDEVSKQMAERMLDILEDKKAPISYLNLPMDLAKKEIR